MVKSEGRTYYHPTVSKTEFTRYVESLTLSGDANKLSVLIDFVKNCVNQHKEILEILERAHKSINKKA